MEAAAVASAVAVAATAQTASAALSADTGNNASVAAMLPAPASSSASSELDAVDVVNIAVKVAGVDDVASDKAGGSVGVADASAGVDDTGLQAVRVIMDALMACAKAAGRQWLLLDPSLQHVALANPVELMLFDAGALDDFGADESFGPTPSAQQSPTEWKPVFPPFVPFVNLSISQELTEFAEGCLSSLEAACSSTTVPLDLCAEIVEVSVVCVATVRVRLFLRCDGSCTNPLPLPVSRSSSNFNSLKTSRRPSR